MSFHVSFHAPTKARAKELVAKASLPDPVRAFINSAIDAVDNADELRPRVIHVHAVGHLAESPGSYGSSADIKVTPLSLS